MGNTDRLLKGLLLPLLLLVSTAQAHAETVECEGKDQATNLPITIRIRPERSVGAPPELTYLAADAKRGDRWLSSRTDVWLVRTPSGLVYRDRVFPKGFSLTMSEEHFPGHEMAATLVLDKGMVYESTYSDLTCRVHGNLLYPLDSCPQDASSSRAALFKAAKSGTVRDLENLLGCGINPNQVDQNRCSPLHFVTDLNCGKPAFIGNPDGGPADPGSATPVDHRGRGSLVEEEFIRLLASARADLNLVDRFGNSALVNSARNQQLSSVSALIELGANLNHQDALGNSSVMYAAINGDELLIRTLLDANPDLRLKNRKNKTALDLANDYGHSHLAELLAPKTEQFLVTGKSDGTCEPTMIHIYKGRDAEIVLEAKSSKMFLLEAPDLGLELMAMPNGKDSKVIRPAQTGTFPFTCGVHGAPANQQTRGSFMVM